MATIAMPRLSDSMEDGTIVRWLVADGAEVRAGEELVEVETDKAVMPYEAEQAGTLRIVAAEGSTVAVGAPIAELVSDGEAVSAASSAAPAVLRAGPVGSGRAHPGSSPGARASSPPPARSASVVDDAAPRASNDGPVAVSNGGRVAASPVARRVAAELGVDLRALVGSGPGGRIVKRDVLGASGAAGAGGGAVAAPSPARPADGAPAPASAAGGRGAVTVEQPTRIQQTIARRMAEAKSTQPEFTLTVEVEMDAAVVLRGELKASTERQGVAAPSLNDLVVKAVALALREHPRANGAYKDGAFELYERVNVGVAVAAADALLVPVVTDADALSLGAIAARTRELATRAREGTLTPPELSGGTFTVSNLGMFGIAHFTAILNAPQAGILAVGAVRETPVVRDGELAIGRRMTATLTCDHRILYGADAAQFLADVRGRLEDPLRLIL